MNQEEILEVLNSNHIDNTGKQIFLDLYKKNNDLFNTIDFAILDTKYTSKFTTNELLRITCDKRIQNSLINLDNNQYELFFKLKDNFFDETNWITGTNAILKAFNNNEFNMLINDVAMSDNPSVLANYYALINQDKNYFGITTVEQLENFEQIRDDVCNTIIDSPENTNLLPDALKDMSSIDRYKFAIIEKKYGISLSQAKLLCQKYAFDIENSDDIVCTEEIHIFLTELTQIIKAEDIEYIETLQLSDNTKHNFLDIDSYIRDSFKEMYNSAFYKPKSEDLKGYEFVDGEKIEIYDAGTNFTICSHVVGAYFSVDKDEDFNYKDNWNRPQMASHAFCTRLISNEALETANNQGVSFGFVDFEGNSMLASAPWDLCTVDGLRYNFLESFDMVGEMDEHKKMRACEGSASRFLTPMGQNNNTRGDASETNWDRLNLNGEKKQPAYVLYIANSLENDTYKEEDKYLESIKAAKQFGIPVVLIDRQKVIENEHLEIDRLVEEYKTTKNVSTMKRIIQRFENNRTTYGYQFEFQEKYNAEFPLKDGGTSKSLNSIIQTLVEHSRDDNGNYITGNLQQMIDELIMQTARSHGNGEKEFCEMVYSIKDKDSSLTVDADEILKRYLGITQKEGTPDKISKGNMRSFYFKRENIPEKEPKKQFSKETVESGLFEITDNTPSSEFNDSSSSVRRDVEYEFEDRENTAEEGWTQDDWD